MSTIAFIGLGNMGGPMAANLVKAGHIVRGFDVMEEAKTKARQNGIDVQESATAAVEGAQVIYTMLPNGKLVDAVLTEVLPSASAGALFIDSSTIAVADARAAAEKVQAAGHRFLDAPVSGGIVGAEAGTLAFMVGGDEEVFGEARPLFDVMGRSATLCGDIGSGQAVKICNNMILGVHQIAVAEAMVLGERLGLDPQAFFDVVSNSTGASWALTTNCPVPGPVPNSPANNDFKPGFANALMNKDLGLAKAALEETGTSAVLGQAAAAFYQETVDAGFGDKDCSYVIELVRDR
ncbi:3-hydroxyisobutyrate dehydrogenase [Corynebacterium hindlerae]|uniref:3-hydroxyisobutyrate dehydrogenase n=1 Tax=Corynebacterium hindlerae TaxID=699041 RepID=UPI0031B67A6C